VGSIGSVIAGMRLGAVIKWYGSVLKYIYLRVVDVLIYSIVGHGLVSIHGMDSSLHRAE
jgi:hypothetical protein